MQINNFNSERFRQTTERIQIEINESATIDTLGNFGDTETTIYNIKVVSVDQKALATRYTCSDCSSEVTPDHKDLVDRICGLITARDSFVNDKVMVSVKNEKSIKVNFRTTAGLLCLSYRQHETIKLFTKSILIAPITICYIDVELKFLSSKKVDKSKN